MKKNIKLMLAIMIAAFTFASCSDVPSPYGLFAGDDSELGEATGTGTLEDPFNVPAVLNYIKTLESGATSEDVYIKGIVSQLVEGQNYDSGYGNGTFYISVDGNQKNQFYIYRALYLENKTYVAGPIANIGDEVIVCGKVTMHGSTPETADKQAYLYSINGETKYEAIEFGTAEEPISIAEALRIINELEPNTSAGNAYVKGKVSSVGQFTASTGLLSYYISEDGTSTDQIQVYKGLGLNQAKFAAATDLSAGDEVVVYGPLYKYVNANSGAATPEINSGSYLVSHTKGTGGGGETTTEPKGDGTQNNPYNALGAANAVKNLTWISNTDYQTTEDVYVKGKISRIADKGTFTDGGTYGNASFYISEDGNTSNEFYCFRVLYLNNSKYNEYQGDKVDIKVGDEVVIYGKLMNYKGNTPETVSGKAYVYSINDSGTSGGGETGGGETTGGGSVSINTNSGEGTWEAATDNTYGAGYSTTAQGLNIAYYKHTSSSTPVAPNDSHVRIYKNSVLSIAASNGQKIKKVIIGCAPNVGSSSYCFDMVGLEGVANATADKDALTVTWSGSANKVVLHATNGQVRMEKLTVELE